MVAIASSLRTAPLARATLVGSSARIGARRAALVAPRAAVKDELKESAKEISEQATATATEVGEKIVAWWDASEEKPTIVAAGFGALLVLYFANTIVSAVDHLPLLSTVFELIGLTFTGWTAYRFFLVEGEKDKLVGEVKSFASKVGVDL